MSILKKPPDKFITVKCVLDKIIIDDKPNCELKKDDIKTILNDTCFRTNQIVIHTYQFLRLWILNKYHNKLDIPIITEELIKMVMNTLSIKDNRGNKPTEDNLILLDEFNKFYEEHYKNLNYENKINSSYLSQIINSMATDMLTNIENNVKMHFFKYVNRFVNSSFKKINSDLLEKAKEGTKTLLRKELNKDVYEIKQDLINNTLKSNEKYHKWINTHRDNIFYKDFVNSYEFDIQNNPQRYLKSMIYMCEQIEKLETKSFQFFPLRTDITQKYCPLDTKSLIELFIKKDKGKYLDDIEKYKEHIWSMLFDISKPIFKQSNYTFDYKIYTDGYSVSIQMLKNDKVDSEKQKKQNMKNKRRENKELTKNMTEKEKVEFKKKCEEEKKKQDEEFKLKLKEKKDKEKEAFKKLTKEEQNKILDKRKQEIKEAKILNGTDFLYLEDLNEKQLEEIKKNNWLTVDPGVNCLIMMKDKNGKKYRYTNRKHVKLTKRLKYQRLIQNYKNKNDISKVENELTKYNSKTCNLDNFKKFIKNKNKINSMLFDKYNKEIFRKYKWYGFLNRKHTETKMIKEIKNTFGKNSIIFYGDFGFKTNCHKGNISTPNNRLKRLIGKQMKLYNLDEFRTSKLNHKTEEVCENLYLPDLKGKSRKIHSVLTYKMENEQIGCINRDENAVNNMIKIVNHYLNKKERLLKYRRDYDLEKGELKAETKQKVITSIKNDTTNREVKYQPCSK
jgi:hypothetical protein